MRKGRHPSQRSSMCLKAQTQRGKQTWRAIGRWKQKGRQGQIKTDLCTSLKSWILKLIQEDTCIPGFTAAAFTVAKIKKQP